MASCLSSCTPNPMISKGVYSKRKEFAPLGSKFFPFRVDSFSEGRQNQFVRIVSPESVSLPLKDCLRTAKIQVSPQWRYEHHDILFLFVSVVPKCTWDIASSFFWHVTFDLRECLFLICESMSIIQSWNFNWSKNARWILLWLGVLHSQLEVTFLRRVQYRPV